MIGLSKWEVLFFHTSLIIVNYLYYAAGYSGGMTPLLDREGKPVVSPIRM